jgi:tetratricopeptide (TPR) repeat protein
MSSDTTNEIFCSYAHEDLAYVKEFHKHLSLLQRDGLISTWYDGLIGAGQQWQREIETHLNNANIILLFISADFLNSDFCMETELPIALDRSNRQDALVIPIILRPCDWQNSTFAHLQALPTGAKPIAAWQHRDEAYTEIVKSIRGFVHNKQVPPMRCSLLNLPFRRNPLFTGREEILQKLHATLASGKETALVQAIKGMGGIGKTQTAIEYAYRYQQDYRRIIWLNSESRETIISDIVKLAREINTPGCYDQDQNKVVQSFLAWLERQHNWLLILDNVEDLSLAHSYMPRGDQGHLLLTTRRQAVGGAITGISLETMDEETGATFLLKRSKLIDANLSPEQIPVEEMKPAKKLSHILGGLPLALDQAGGYIERKQCSLERYTQLYEQAHERLLAEHGFPEDTTNYPYTVATTWSLSFQQVAQEQYGRAATDLLRLCAFLAPDDIPLRMFETIASAVSNARDLFGPDLGQLAADPMQLEDALEALLKYSLIRREGDALFIHRLVQTVLRDAMTEEEHSLWSKRAVELMGAVFPDPDEVEYWPTCQYFLPHMLACAIWIEHSHIRTEQSARLLNQAAYYLNCQGLYAEAEPLWKETLVIRRDILGEQHPNTVASLSNLAELYRNQGRSEDAEPLMKQALVIRWKVLGGQHPDTASSLNNLAGLYGSQERYKEAERLYQEALAIKRKVLGEQHPDTAISLHGLATLYCDQKRYEEAELLYKESLAIWQKVLGEQHPNTAKSLHGLATLYWDQRRYEEAEPLMKQALLIKRKVLREQHPDIAISLNRLAMLYENQGRYEEAKPLYEEALASRREELGALHSDTATSLNNLAELYKKQGRYEETERLHKESLAIRRKILGEQHPDTAISLNNLGDLYNNQRRYEEAEPLLKEALKINREVLGKQHPDTALSLNNLATLYDNQRRNEVAEALYKYSLAIQQKVLAEQHPDTAASLNNLAELYKKQRRYEEAEPLYQQALAIFINVLGEEHPTTQVISSNYALFLKKKGEVQKTE